MFALVFLAHRPKRKKNCKLILHVFLLSHSAVQLARVDASENWIGGQCLPGVHSADQRVPHSRLTPCLVRFSSRNFGNPSTDPFLAFVLANQLFSINICFRLQGYISKYTWSASHGATFEILPLAPPHIFLCLRWLRVPWKVCLHRDFTHPEISLGLRSSSPQAPYNLHL